MSKTFGVSEMVAIGALGASIWAIFQTHRFNQRQVKWERTAERLNQLLIEREAAESETQKKAELGVNIVRTGRTDYRMKIFNRGKAAARNVRLEELIEDGLLSRADIERKFPAPAIEPQAGIELFVMVHMQSVPRTHVRLTWDDDFGLGQTKDFHPSW